MRLSQEAHKEFKAEWKRFDTGTRYPETPELIKAREMFFVAHNRLFSALQEYEKDFYAGQSEAIDSVLNFLEVDIPAFRCGYAKQKFFRKLKSFDLNEIQKQRIRKLAYNLSVSESYRVEFRDLARLVIKHADVKFVEDIRKAAENSNGRIRFKCELMLQTILQNRADFLRNDDRTLQPPNIIS